MRIDLFLDERARTSATGSQGESSRISFTDSGGTTSEDFNLLLQSLYDAALLTDFNGTITNANERALRFFDLRRDAILGLAVGSLIAGASSDILSTVIENVNSERFTLLQAHCIRSDGSLFPAEISVTCLKLAPLPVLCFFIRDITQRRELEETIRVEQGAVQNAGSGIAISDTSGVISYVNPAMRRLWNWSSATDLPCLKMHGLFCDPQEFALSVEDALVKRTWNGELKARRADGGTFYVQTSITSSVDEDQTITNLVYSFADTTKRREDEEALRLYQDHLEDLITERTADLETSNRDLKSEIAERTHAEEDLREAIRKLHEHDTAKSRFVSNVSHELRTPLTSLIHATENLMRGVAGQVGDGVYSYLTMMLEDCWRLDRTICDILDLSRIESGSLKLNRACIPFRSMVEWTAEALRMEIEDAALTLRMEPDAASGFVLCDAAKVERVITNILGNAIKFTPAGGFISIAILARNHQGTDGICCRITDSGAGIPAQYLNRVTERFFRVGEQVGGTGLGLSIAKEITELHQGALEIASPPPGADSGTQVSLWLPTEPPPQVLIVAHDSGLRSEIVPALQRHGYRTVCHESGQIALQMLRDGNLDIVIVDSLIPDMDGMEIIMHIKADALLRTLPLFLLSEEAPSKAKSSILLDFDVPVFLKTTQPEDLACAVDLALLPQHNGYHKLVNGRNPPIHRT